MAVVGLVGGCAAPRQPRTNEAHRATDGWQTVPEVHGFDSSRLADALLAICDKGRPVHNIVLVRGGEMVLEAYHYPYDGSTVHELLEFWERSHEARFTVVAEPQSQS